METSVEPSVAVSQLSEALRTSASDTNGKSGIRMSTHELVSSNCLVASLAYLFSPEIDQAPDGIRVPTPPPPDASELGTSQSSYIDDLAGLQFQASAEADPLRTITRSEEGDGLTEEVSYEEVDNTESPTVTTQPLAVDIHVDTMRLVVDLPERQRVLDELRQMLPTLTSASARHEVSKHIAEGSQKLRDLQIQLLQQLQSHLPPQSTFSAVESQGTVPGPRSPASTQPRVATRANVEFPGAAHWREVEGITVKVDKNPTNNEDISKHTRASSSAGSTPASALGEHSGHLETRVEPSLQNYMQLPRVEFEPEENLPMTLGSPPLSGNLDRSLHSGTHMPHSEVVFHARLESRDSFIIGEHNRPVGRFEGGQEATATSLEHLVPATIKSSLQDGLASVDISLMSDAPVRTIAASSSSVDGIQRPEVQTGYISQPTQGNAGKAKQDAAAAVEESVARPQIKGSDIPNIPDDAITRQYAHRPNTVVSRFTSTTSVTAPQRSEPSIYARPHFPGRGGTQVPRDTSNTVFSVDVPGTPAIENPMFDSRGGFMAQYYQGHDGFTGRQILGPVMSARANQPSNMYRSLFAQPASQLEATTTDTRSTRTSQLNVSRFAHPFAPTNTAATNDGSRTTARLNGSFFERPSSIPVRMAPVPQLPAFLAGNTAPLSDPGAAARLQYGGDGGRPVLAPTSNRINQSPVRSSTTHSTAGSDNHTDTTTRSAKDPWEQVRRAQQREQ